MNILKIITGNRYIVTLKLRNDRIRVNIISEMFKILEKYSGKNSSISPIMHKYRAKIQESIFPS